MSESIASGLRAEWLVLQTQHEQYEWAALVLKLGAVLLLAAAPAHAWVAVLLLLLWAQETVLKTFQARLSERLLRVERGLREDPAMAEATPVLPMQLHSEWQQARPRGLALLKEYAGQACRPTVLLPYPVLLLVWLLMMMRA